MHRTSDETAIANLLYRYAEVMDAGDLEAAAASFAHAELVVAVGAPPVSGTDMLEIWRRLVIIHDDGTPRTRHVVTNPIIELADDGRTATSRSVYTVFQQVGGTPFGPIVGGRYHDAFEAVEGAWRFTHRDYSLVDFVGDTSQHLRLDLADS